MTSDQNEKTKGTGAPPEITVQAFRNMLPWGWSLISAALFFLGVQYILPGSFIAYYRFTVCAGIAVSVPLLIGGVLAAMQPFITFSRERDPRQFPLARFEFKRLKWVRGLLLFVIIDGAAVLIARVLGYPDAFVSNLITVLILFAAVYTAFLPLPGKELREVEGGRQIRWSILITRTVIAISTLFALLGYVNLAWRLAWLFMVGILVDDGYRIGLACVERWIIARVFARALEAPPKGKDGFDQAGFRRQRSKTVANIRFLYKVLFTLTAAWLFLLIIGLTPESISRLIEHVLFTIGSATVTCKAIIKALLVLVIVNIFGRSVKCLLMYYVFPRSSLETGTFQTLSNMIFIGVLVVGYITALSMFGVSLMGVSLIGGGLAVGIGFGLQNITNNIISGVILFFERPINVKDVIDVNGTLGIVRQIGIRSTVISTFDNITVIIPNSEFISGTVVNWSWGDITMRLDVPIGVAYGSDVDMVKDILEEVAHTHGLIKDHPGPEVLFQEFGDNSLNFVLRVWLKDLRKRPQVLSDINFMIDARFRDANIEIPFPQRDVYIRQNTAPEEKPKYSDEKSEPDK